MGSWQALHVLRIDFASLGHAKHIHAQESRFGAAQREWGDGLADRAHAARGVHEA